MTKKYKCRLSATSLLINCKGSVIRLEFDADVVSPYGLRGCSYSTENQTIQRAIEHSKRFNSHQADEIWTDDVEVVIQDEKIPEIAKAYADVSEKVEAARQCLSPEGKVVVTVKQAKRKAKKEA